MTKLLLIRHGHVEGIYPERFRGHADLPLTKRGVAEALAVAKRVAAAWRPVKIYSSPMRRCFDTGSAIGHACHVDVEIMDDLVDINYGDWQSKTYEEIRETNPHLFSAWFETPHLVRFPSGESLQELVARAADGLRFALEFHPKETVVLVSHTSLNRALLLQLLDQPLSSYWRLEQEPCCINEVEIDDGRIRVLRVNDVFHLQGADKPLSSSERTQP